MKILNILLTFLLISLKFSSNAQDYNRIKARFIIKSDYPKSEEFVFILFDEKLRVNEKYNLKDLKNRFDKLNDRDAIYRKLRPYEDDFKEEIINPNIHYVYILKKYDSGRNSYGLIFNCKRLSDSLSNEDMPIIVNVKPNINEDPCSLVPKKDTTVTIKKPVITKKPKIEVIHLKLYFKEIAYLFEDQNENSKKVVRGVGTFYRGKAYEKLDQSKSSYPYIEKNVVQLNQNKSLLVKGTGYERWYKVKMKNKENFENEGWIKGRFTLENVEPKLEQSDDFVIRTTEDISVYLHFNNLKLLGKLEKGKIRVVLDKYEIGNLVWYKVRLDNRVGWINPKGVVEEL